LRYFYLDFFFFSSRRRHTRSYGDWSSDVCSSDYRAAAPPYERRRSWQRSAASHPRSCHPRRTPRAGRADSRSRGSSRGKRRCSAPRCGRERPPRRAATPTHSWSTPHEVAQPLHQLPDPRQGILPIPDLQARPGGLPTHQLLEALPEGRIASWVAPGRAPHDVEEPLHVPPQPPNRHVRVVGRWWELRRLTLQLAHPQQREIHARGDRELERAPEAAV